MFQWIVDHHRTIQRASYWYVLVAGLLLVADSALLRDLLGMGMGLTLAVLGVGHLWTGRGDGDA